MMGFKELLKNKKIKITFLVFVLFLLLYLFSRPAAPLVLIVQVERGTLRREISDFGTTRFKDVFSVLAPSSGWITRIYPRVGDSVKESTSPIYSMSSGVSPLIDPRTRKTLKAQYETSRSQADQAQALVRRVKINLQSAENELQRFESVFQTGALSVQDIEKVRTQVRDLQEELHSAEAGLDAARHQREAARAALGSGTEKNSDNFILHAPRSGIVSWVYDEKPRFVTTGTPLLDIAQTGALSFEMDLLAREAMDVRPGMPVRFSDFPVGGRVRMISPTALPKISPLGISEQRTRLWIEFEHPPDARVPSGLELEAHIELGSKVDTLILPNSAVWTEDNKIFVFRESNGRILKTPITVGLKTLHMTEVINGLSQGDPVVLLPTEEMHSQQKIRPQQKRD